MIEIKFEKDPVKYWQSVAERARIIELEVTMIERKLSCGCSNLITYCSEHEAKRTANKKLEQENPHAYWEKITEGLEEEDRKQLIELWTLRAENEQLKQRIDECDTEHLSKITRLQRELDEAKQQIELQKSAFKRALKAQVSYWHNAFEDYKKAFYSEDRGEAVALLQRELDEAKARNRVQDEQYRQHIDRLQERIAKLEAREKEYIEECNKHFEAVQVANKYSAKLEAELKAMKEERKCDCGRPLAATWYCTGGCDNDD